MKTRFAPSPTGTLHIGGLRTALFNYLIAKKNNGKFLLRIEDTDKERSKKEWEGEIIENLKWLGLKWDGKAERQSDRTKIYKKYLEKMLEEGTAYYCFCTPEELEKEREELMKQGKAPVHQGKYRDLPLEEALKKKEKSVIRFKIAKQEEISFNDIIRGEVKIHTDNLGDFVIAKDLETPLYNFTCVVDDYEMKITHVIRGEEHIANTPKQILLQKALGFSSVEYAHIPLILGKDKKKLSKREGATSVSDYRKEGYLPEAIINFIAFLGWNPGTEKEIYSMKELIKDFSLEKIQKAGAVFNQDKLDWINGTYIRKMDTKELAKLCTPYLKEKWLINDKTDKKYIEKAVSLYQERLKKFSEIPELTDFLFIEDIDYEPELLMWKDSPKEQIKESLQNAYDFITQTKEINQDNLTEQAQKAVNIGTFMWPLRVALSGKKASAGPVEILNVLSREESLRRIKKAIDNLA